MAQTSPPIIAPIPETRWFALLDVGLVAFAGAAWFNWPELGALPLLVALLPWAVRLFYARFPFKRTPLDIPFLVLLVTAAIGVWAAYDHERALAKFWLILDGVLLFYALAAQPRENRWTIAAGLGGFAVAVCFYYFLTHDWLESPAKIVVLNRVGRSWMQVRPTVPLRALHPNVIGGIIITLSPYLIAVTARAYRKQLRLNFILAGLGVLFCAFTLLMTTSRGAWIALTIALAIWVLWGFCDLVSDGKKDRQFILFSRVVGGLTAMVLAVGILFPSRILALANSLPGPEHAGSRLDLVDALLYLIGDFPITGGGLDSFPGLYARYILVNPSYNLEHGHNMFLDMTLEQGIFGGFAVVALFGITLWLFMVGARDRQKNTSSTTLLLWASLAGLVALGLHGLMDDALYGSRAQMLLWVTPGFGLSLLAAPRAARKDPQKKRQGSSNLVTWLTAGASAAVLLVYLFIFRDTISVVWRANLGAVRMSQIELIDFPTDTWDDGSEVGALTPAAAIFESVVRDDPGNRTARYRLGLIALLTRNFPVAVEHLEVAYRSAPSHSGIHKSLGYAYLWDGRMEAALPILARVPEAGFELGVYAYWWRDLDRSDLAGTAAEALEQLIAYSP